MTKYWYAVIEVYRWRPSNGKSLCIVKSARKTRLPRWIQAKYKDRKESIIFRLGDFKIALRGNARILLESKLNQWMSEEEFKELADAVANAIKTRKARERFKNAVKEILETKIVRRPAERSKEAKYHIIKHGDIPVFIRKKIKFNSTRIYVSKKYYIVGTPDGSVFISKQAVDEGDDCIGPIEHVHLDQLDIMKSATSLFYDIIEKDGRIISFNHTILADTYPKLACFFRKFIENYRVIELDEDVELSMLLERVKSLQKSLDEMLAELKYSYIDYYKQMLNSEERNTLYDVLLYLDMKRVITNNLEDLISKINRVIQILNEHIEKLKKAYTEKKLFG